MLSKYYALIICIVSSFVYSAFAIQCYHCNNLAEPTCGENFQSQERYKVDCDRLQQQLPHQTQRFGPFYTVNATGCVKSLFNYLPGDPRIERSCFYGDARFGCQPGDSPPSVRPLICDVCTSDYCNGSSAISSTGFGIALLLVFARLFA